MNKVVLIPDSFKGTMSSMEICGIMERALHRRFPGAEAVSVPVADGGEGTVDCFLTAVGGERISRRVQGPYGEEMEAFYGVTRDGTAVVEMAACAGLPLVEGNAHPERTTTYGVGQLIADAAGRGCKRIILGLGGSATNDGGCGAAAACGAVFRDAAGEAFVPVGGTLSRIASVDVSALRGRLAGVELVAMCDIDNPLYGPSGAACVFAPQKGADDEMVRFLDGQLESLGRVLEGVAGGPVAALPGAGAAGGMGAGMVAFFGSRLQMGIEAVLDNVHFDEALAGADYVFTGEGKIDAQSLRGKVVIGVARRAQRAGVPVVAVVGDIGDGIGEAYGMGVGAVFSINSVAVDFSQARLRSKRDMDLTMDNILRLLQAAER